MLRRRYSNKVSHHHHRIRKITRYHKCNFSFNLNEFMIRKEKSISVSIFNACVHWWGIGAIHFSTGKIQSKWILFAILTHEWISRVTLVPHVMVDLVVPARMAWQCLSNTISVINVFDCLQINFYQIRFCKGKFERTDTKCFQTFR